MEDIDNKIKILIVDDDALMLQQIKMMLQRLGLNQLTIACEGAQALEELDSQNDFELIILDINMPGMDGIEFMRNLALRKFAGAIALFSSEDVRIVKAVENLADAHNLQVIGALAKPVTLDQLKELMASYKNSKAKTQRPAIKEVSVDELKIALDAEEVQPYLQPKVSAKNKKLVSAEVLARWCKPDGSIVPPIAFISVAEENGLIEQLSYSIFEQAVKAYSIWHSQGIHFLIAVNISTDNLENIMLPEELSDIASKYSVPTQNIILEITESKLMQNLTTSLDVLARLRLKGFELSIDDFGTGYSSMSQLKQLPVSELKIDRAFVHNVQNDHSARAILESSVELARKLGLKTVAEGVEDQQDWDTVVEVGCDTIQGYFISRPLSVSQFDAWLASESQNE